MMDPAAIRVKCRILKSSDFPVMGTDEDRVKFMIDGFLKYDFDIDRYPSEVKSSVASERFRNQGNKSFTSNPPTSSALESVLETYSKSVAYAPLGSRELSLAYANRSAVLFKANRHEECLLDIDRALRTGHPDELKPKLLIRMAKSTYALTGTMDTAVNDALREARSLIEQLPPENKNRQAVENILNDPDSVSSVGKFVKKSSETDYTLRLEKENPNFPGASDAIKLKYSEEYGVHTVATRDIKSGEVLILQKPYVAIVDADAWYKLCAYCGKRSWNGIPCDHCVYVMYCSDECKHAAWSEYHDVECQVLGPAIALEYHSFMGLRLTVKALKEAGSFEKLKQRLDELDSLQEHEPAANIQVDPTSYSTIYTMPDIINSINAIELPCLSSNAVELAYFLATRTEIFGQRFERNLKAVKDAQWFTFAAALMAKNMRIGRNGGCKIYRKTPDGEAGQFIYMLIPALCFASHSCGSPISLYPASEATGVVITSIPIKKGDQVFVSHGPYFMDANRDQRRELRWHRGCNCAACEYDWSPATCTSYRNQGLPRRIIRKLDKVMDSFTRDSEEMLRQKSQDGMKMMKSICTSMDRLYPNVRLPCTEVEVFMKFFFNALCCLTKAPSYDETFQL